MLRPPAGSDAPIRRYWELAHSIGGKVLPVFAWMTAFSGLYYLRASAFALFLVFLYILLVIIVVIYAEYKRNQELAKATEQNSTGNGIESAEAAGAAPAVAAGATTAGVALDESSVDIPRPPTSLSDSSEVELEQVTL